MIELCEVGYHIIDDSNFFFCADQARAVLLSVFIHELSRLKGIVDDAPSLSAH